MGIWQRISLIFRSKANKALDRAEDPRETLDYSYQRQLDLLSKVRRGVADVATSRKRVELQVNELDTIFSADWQMLSVSRRQFAPNLASFPIAFRPQQVALNHSTGTATTSVVRVLVIVDWFGARDLIGSTSVVATSYSLGSPSRVVSEGCHTTI